MLKLGKYGGNKMSDVVSFEENLVQLKEIVEKLENGKLSLKESVEKFQEGLNIIKQCHKELETAELKIETIVKKDGKITIEPLRKE